MMEFVQRRIRRETPKAVLFHPTFEISLFDLSPRVRSDISVIFGAAPDRRCGEFPFTRPLGHLLLPLVSTSSDLELRPAVAHTLELTFKASGLPAGRWVSTETSPSHTTRLSGVRRPHATDTLYLAGRSDLAARCAIPSLRAPSLASHHGRTAVDSRGATGDAPTTARGRDRLPRPRVQLSRTGEVEIVPLRP